MQTRCSNRQARAYSFWQDSLFLVSSCLFVLIGLFYVFDCRQPDPQVATPTFSPDGGTFVSSVEATISCATSGATIRYTTDLSTPALSHGQV